MTAVVVSAKRSSLLPASGTALATLGLFALVGHLSARSQGIEAPDLTSQDSRSALELFALIVGRNVPLALLLFSGVATAAATTLLAGMLLGVYLGATFTVAAQQAGVAAMFGSIAVYGPFELAGFVVAATAGVLPTVRVATLMLRAAPEASRSPRRYAREYGNAVSTSLRLLAVAVVLLLLAALLEAVVIVSR